MRAVMIQGTGSDVGKSMLVAGLCRAARRRGLSVAPFKPQNMSNNAAVTADGGEIGRAQALQAMACGLMPMTDMNPVLLKPETDIGAQVVVQGQRLTSASARDYGALKPTLMAAVLESFTRLKAAHDLVIVEGAGSPAEVNLRPRDIANMGFAVAADVPVVLAGDIDRGGVIAQIVGTQAVIDPGDAAMIAGFLVNKFRGDVSLFDDGYARIESETGWPGFGVLPWFHDAWKLPAEDALSMGAPKREGGFHIVCLALSRIANFDDLDPLMQEPGVRLTMLGPGRAIPGDADLVILPGTKSTRGDLAFLRAQGWDVDLAAHHRRGGHILGICGGYQMLGRVVADPEGIEGPAGETPGLGFLDIETVMTPAKRLTEVDAVHAASGAGFHGYEIHIGVSDGPDRARPFAYIADTPEGAVSADGRVQGSYLHGMFRDDEFRAAWLGQFDVAASDAAYGESVEQTLDALADHMEAHLDVSGLLGLAR
ncbi:cobyric acid synthase [Roseobacter sp. HKCCD9010]|uniref:cobyric acid synthase n=1 Tax=unclassified Roseobacter TaxID=196798 RepID=UPI001492007F|nr:MULTISPECIES: cobyric acid synthase [unclassified Roseobacter]MBF9048656.1 cobyric acid synthase [Rhodobacterales bacterium HKCCD4356]NNV10655.1 cobyric acid synthase [Roseobacter sp. HKCCD7357]NNV14840.1 cobyric acid synthase [Roseobacter sp. HKCCD8768]NNV24299.1 cobyric acid synthase [Roseobacter sp. HKCCD8192]NNV28556.1 cobyric acid synthase [Roseobacter sp. HKCCD9061]